MGFVGWTSSARSIPRIPFIPQVFFKSCPTVIRAPQDGCNRLSSAQREKPDLPRVIRVVDRHAEELLRERLIFRLWPTRELSVGGRSHGVDEPRVVGVEQREVLAPRFLAGLERRHR